MGKRIRINLIYMFILCLSAINVLYSQDNSKKKGENQNEVNAVKDGENKAAKELALDLMKRLDLTLEQTQKVQDILADYQKDLADRRGETDSKVVDRNDKADNNRNGEDFVRSLSDIDVTANDKIEDIVDDEKRPEYNRVKKGWWSKIKKEVYSRNINVVEDQQDNKRVDRRSADVVKQTVNNKDSVNNNIADMQSEFARKMAMDLMKELNLSLNQAADIQQALISYQEDIADARRDTYRDEDNDSRNVSRNEENDRNNVTGSTRNEKMSEIDESANDEIENVLTEKQKPEYLKIKKQWWSKVKTRLSAG